MAIKHLLAKKIVRQLIAITVVSATLFFFVRTLLANWGELQDVDFGFNGWALLSIILFAVAVMISGLLWGDVVNRLSPKKPPIPAWQAVRVHMLSWLLKYIPGQAGSLLSKMAWGQKRGYSKKLMSISFVYENAFLVLASALLSLPVLYIFFEEQFTSNLSAFAPLLLIIPMLIVLQKDVFYHLLNFVFKKVRGQTVSREYFLSTPQLMGYTLKYIIPRVITGVAFICTVASLVPVSYDMYIGLIAIYTLAGVVGLLAIFVPSGLGVREAIIVIFATPYFSVEMAIVIALLARFYATLADILLAILYFAFRKKGDNS